MSDAMGSTQQRGGSDAGPTPEISEDEMFDVLSNQRRRYVVHMLKHDSETVELGDMAEQIAAWENDIEVGDVSGVQRKRVYTALQQSHLPKMEEAGVVAFRKEHGYVEPTPALENVDVYLDVVRGKEIPWSEYYLGLSATASALVAAVWVGAWPFVLLPDLAWAGFIAAVFTVSAIAHWLQTTTL